VESPDTLVQAPVGAPDSATPALPEDGLHAPASRGPFSPAGRGGTRVAREVEPHEGALLLGRYRLLERLGAGGFGEVWRAQDETLHREVALKRIRLGSGGEHIDPERAEREALACARLAHPAIVALYEACAREQAFYLISELVQGATLAQLIAEDALEDEEIVEIGLALVDALAHAHARGVIHRDIKPHNVLVPDGARDAAGAAKLTDFGGASLVGEDALTRTGDVLGTLAYMAPEQSDGREVGAEADLYALALLLYEALSGVNPVRGATPAATARRIGGRIEPLARSRGDLPRALTRSIDRALSADPRQRGSLRELGAALAQSVGADGLQDDDAAPAAAAMHTAVQPAFREPPAWDPRAGARADAFPAASAAAMRVPRARAHAIAGPAVHARVAPEPTARERRNSGPDGEPPADAPARRRAPALPRIAWLAAAAGLVLWQAFQGRPGAALVIAAAAAPLLLLPRRTGPGWLLSALAPALGLAGLAGAYPAIAGQPRRWRERALLGALGYWWLTLAEPLAGRRLWLGVHAGTPVRAVWEASLGSTATHVIGPLLSPTVLLGACLWALGAVLVPLLVRGRNASLDIVAATVWSAVLALAVPAAAAAARAGGPAPSPRGLVLGAVLGGFVVVAVRALAGPVRPNGA
jgi:tRNA A-37 threonylcarbamoyl transferase component Bud32